MPVLKFKHPTTGKWLPINYASTAGFSPQIIVIADAGSTVICTKGEITLTAEEVDGTWTFEVPEYGEWDVVAEYDSLLGKETVLVDCVKQYAVHLDVFEERVNYTMLYDYGEECTDTTGGWNTYNKTAGYSSISKNSTDIYMQVRCSAGTTKAYIWAAPAQELPLSEYTKLAAKTRFTVKISGLQNLLVTSPAMSADTNIMLGPEESYACYSEPSGACDKTSFLQLDLSQVERGVPVVGLCSDYAGQESTLTLYTAFLLKQDDWETLGQIIGGTTWETMDQLLGDGQTLTRILGNKTAVRYMTNKCTGDFMMGAITSAVFLAALEGSPYKELVYANEHWSKFLAMVA